MVKITDIQEPNVEDLLGREEIDPNPELMKKNIFKKLYLSQTLPPRGSELRV